MPNLDRTKQTNETDRLISMLESKIGTVEKTIGIRKKYVALLTQTGTTAPTATVLENAIGDITWTYSAVGTYLGKSAGLFTEKTYIPVQMANYVDLDGDVFRLVKTDNSTLTLTTWRAGAKINDLMANFQLEFSIY